jgi:hypothetical protein
MLELASAMKVNPNDIRPQLLSLLEAKIRRVESKKVFRTLIRSTLPTLPMTRARARARRVKVFLRLPKQKELLTPSDHRYNPDFRSLVFLAFQCPSHHPFQGKSI